MSAVAVKKQRLPFPTEFTTPVPSVNYLKVMALGDQEEEGI
jgi:hypothetical protein